MEGLSQRAELCTIQREQERERRRIRDRQRRQSMTQEQRERHLARRRKNYQLRRLRAENARRLTNSQALETSIGTEMSTSDEYQTTTSNSDHGVLYDDVSHEGQGLINQGKERLNLECTKFDGNLSRKMRLSQIRRLARLAIHPICEITNKHQLEVEFIGKGDTGGTSKTLRLNLVKHLARSLNSASKETITDQSHNSNIEVVIQ
ncbi:serine/threonine-protein kinase pakA isoform X1 [Quillaja saponaria]|uniref:Serine/threonine-protein kinase pakA isoform X1 n=1 Tax=Quillaja saponaria TaxID=32244 RepID=A0AAD7KV48_QUISA|nr:serine/threonine-protein kinase pakA isoform X1 [Quillaja saponaria]